MSLKRTFSLVALAAVCAAGDTEEDFSETDMHYSDQDSYKHDAEVMLWYVSAIRGAWFGFYRGFFHDQKKPQSQCLSSNMEKEVAEIMQWLAYGELVDIFKVADSMTNLYYDNRLGCGYADIQHAIDTKCKETGENGESVCSLSNYFFNLSSVHLIESMGQSATMSNAIKEFHLKVDKDSIYEQTLLIGKASGALLAYAFDL